MRSASTPPRRRLALLGGVAALCLSGLGLSAVTLPLLPSLAGPGPAGSDGQFRPVDGDGSLPERAPDLRPADAPLSVAERGYAIHLAQQAMPPGSEDVLGLPGGEVLAADLPPVSERTSARLVAVAVYDYASDRLHQMVADLTDRSVVSDRTAQELQLPPTEAETTIAVQVAMTADPAPAFVAEYRRVTGAALITPGQIQAIAGVWRPVDASAAEGRATAVCGPHRCLQLLIALPSGQYLATQDFAVDLSSRTVLPVGPAEQEHRHED